MVAEIVNSATNPDNEHVADEDEANMLESCNLETYPKPLKASAQAKHILVALGRDNEPLFTALRSI